MTWQEDAEVVRLGPDPNHPTVFADAVDRLIAALEAAEERLTAYETPSQEVKRLEAALREITQTNWPDKIQPIARSALGEGEK